MGDVKGKLAAFVKAGSIASGAAILIYSIIQAFAGADWDILYLAVGIPMDVGMMVGIQVLAGLVAVMFARSLKWQAVIGTAVSIFPCLWISHWMQDAYFSPSIQIRLMWWGVIIAPWSAWLSMYMYLAVRDELQG